tara:strand:- start:293 stop:1375 length:1083 start_codon:yes stop_codon:yes gene_type:complete
MGDLLKEAIADAKAVRETALQNAKMALEEAFTPQLKSMLSAKLKEEEGVPFDEEEVGDGLDDEEVDQDISHSPEGTEGEADEEATDADEPSATAGEDEESGVPGSQEETEYEEDAVGDGLEDDEVPAEGEELNQEGFYNEEEEETEEGEYEEDEEMEENSLDLEAIIRELEDEVGAEEDEEMEEEEEIPAEEEEVPAEEEEVPAEEGEYEEDEEMEVDENLWKEEDEADDEDDDEVEESSAHAELKEYKQAVRFLKNKLHEVNILNAKLLFTNKLFKEFALNNNQKLKVVETFDRAQSTREIKLVYSTLAEQFGDNGTIGKKSIKESASARTGSTKPKRKVISEAAQVANRFKKLAGLIK